MLVFRLLAALTLIASLGAAAMPSPDGSGWTYSSDFGGAPSPQFVSSDDTLLVYELRLAPYRERIRFLSADGEVLSETELTHRGRRMPYDFVLVDRWHVALPMADPSRIGLVPEATSPSPTAQAFLSWARSSGDIAPSKPLDASTNPHADLSCAIGADRSIAVWRTIGPSDFRASPPNAIPAGNFIAEIFCLEAEGRPYVAVHLIDERYEVPHRSWVRIYEAGADAPAVELPLVLDGISYLLHGRPAGAGLLVGLTSARATDQNEWTQIATRISFAGGQWRIERAQLTGEWPRGLRDVRAHDILLAPDDDAIREMVSVPWEVGQTTIPYAPRTFATRPPGFPGPYAISPSGRRLVWTDHGSSIRMTPGGADLAE